jgi:hypothetical protein
VAAVAFLSVCPSCTEHGNNDDDEWGLHLHCYVAGAVGGNRLIEPTDLQLLKLYLGSSAADGICQLPPELHSCTFIVLGKAASRSSWHTAAAAAAANLHLHLCA